MYTELEMSRIFKTVYDFEELHIACEVVGWLVDNGFLPNSLELRNESSRAFQRITAHEVDGYASQTTLFQHYEMVISHIHSLALWQEK